MNGTASQLPAVISEEDSASESDSESDSGRERSPMEGREGGHSQGGLRSGKRAQRQSTGLQEQAGRARGAKQKKPKIREL
jgi:hypothetical protein